jgi:hypothetical protein
METLGPQTLERPSHVDGLLASLVTRMGVVPGEANPVLDCSDLPSVLKRIVITATKAGQSWLAWDDAGYHVWLFIAEMSLPLSRERGSPVLHVKHYRENGISQSATWFIDRRAKWHRVGD